jgi:hypothetical protein
LGVLPDDNDFTVRRTIGRTGNGLVSRRHGYREGAFAVGGGLVLAAGIAVCVHEFSVDVRTGGVAVAVLLPDDKVEIFIGQINHMGVLLIEGGLGYRYLTAH